jgi:hypothetical protein
MIEMGQLEYKIATDVLNGKKEGIAHIANGYQWALFNKNNDKNTLQIIAEAINSGETRGYNPKWSLDIKSIDKYDFR